MKKTIQSKQHWVIVSKSGKEIYCGQWPYEGFKPVGHLGNSKIRMFTNKPMAEEVLRGFRRDQGKFMVVPVVETITMDMDYTAETTLEV